MVFVSDAGIYVLLLVVGVMLVPTSSDFGTQNLVFVNVRGKSSDGAIKCQYSNFFV